MNEGDCYKKKIWITTLQEQGRNNICKSCCSDYRECIGWKEKIKRGDFKMERKYNQTYLVIKYNKTLEPKKNDSEDIKKSIIREVSKIINATKKTKLTIKIFTEANAL